MNNRPPIKRHYDILTLHHFKTRSAKSKLPYKKIFIFLSHENKNHENEQGKKNFFEKFSKSNLIKKYGVIPLTESIIYLENKKTKKLIEDIILNRKKKFNRQSAQTQKHA